MPEPPLSPGLYERLLDEELDALLAAHPEMRTAFATLDDEAEAGAYSQFVAQLLRQALPIADPERRLALVNRVVHS